MLNEASEIRPPRSRWQVSAISSGARIVGAASSPFSIGKRATIVGTGYRRLCFGSGTSALARRRKRLFMVMETLESGEGISAGMTRSFSRFWWSANQWLGRGNGWTASFLHGGWGGVGGILNFIGRALFSGSKKCAGPVPASARLFKGYQPFKTAPPLALL